MRSILERTIQEAKDKVSKKLIQADQCVTSDQINEALQQLKGAVMIVYPMGLPPYDPIELEFKNQEELEGTQVNILQFSFLHLTFLSCRIVLMSFRNLIWHYGSVEKSFNVEKFYPILLGKMRKRK